MIKKFRSLVIVLVALLAGFIYSSNVFAFTSSDSSGTQYLGSGNTLSGAYTYDGVTHNYSIFNHTMNIGGSSYDAFCMDAIRKSGSGNGAHLVKVLDPNDPIDVVLLSIVNSDASYQAKTLAERAFLPLTSYISYWDPGKGSRTGGFNFGEIYTNYNSGIVWAAEEKEATRAIIKKVTGKDLGENFTAKQLYEITGLSDAPGYDGFNTKEVLNESIGTIKEAKEIYKEALKIGAEVAKGNKISDKKVVYSTPDYDTDSYETIEGNDGVKRGSRQVHFEVTFIGFKNASNDPVRLEINPDDQGRLKVEYSEYQIKGDKTDTWTKFDSNTDFRSVIGDNDNITIKVRTRISALVTKEATFNVSFKIKAVYKDIQLSRLSGAIYALNNGYLQRFIVADGDKNTPVDQTGTFPLKWRNTEGFCKDQVPDKNDTTAFKEYLDLCCRGRNDEGFNIKDECAKSQKANNESGIKLWCGLKEEYCDYCNDKVTVPQTCSEISPTEFVNEEDKVATITGPEDIKVCVMDGLDEANHSYLLTKDESVKPKTSENDNGNSYCKVSCKEDYRIQLPTARYVNNGTKFTLKMDIEAQKTCYSDIIDYNKFNEDYAGYVAKIKSHIDAGTANKNNQEFVNTLKAYEKAIKDINACSAGWASDYEFDPEITFDYQEEYIDLLGQHDLKFVSEDKKVKEAGSWFCDGSDVNRKYDQCIGGKGTETKPTTTKSGYKCTLNNDGKTYKCEATDVVVPTSKFAKKTVKGFGTYAPESIFETKFSTGVVKYNPDGTTYQYTRLEEKLATTIPDSDKEEVVAGDLPIALKNGRGVYNYGIKFKGVGEYFDKAGKGRLIGDKTAVAFTNNDTEFKGIYVCSYVVNCKECTVKCEEPKTEDLLIFKQLGFDVDLTTKFCDFDPEPCPDCPLQCDGPCIYDPEYGQLYTVHQTSLTDFNASNRELGSNLTNVKGQAFISELEEKGESIYGEEPEYTFVFTPAAIEFVKQINADSNSYTELPKEWEDKSLYENYSEYVKRRYGENSKQYKEALEHDYKIYKSSVLDELAKTTNAIKYKALLDTREKVVSWLDSDYCKNHACAMDGAVGPAWK